MFAFEDCELSSRHGGVGDIEFDRNSVAVGVGYHREVFEVRRFLDAMAEVVSVLLEVYVQSAKALMSDHDQRHQIDRYYL